MDFKEHVNVPFESPLISIVDYRSDGAEPGRLLEEVVFSRPSIVFPRRGVFLKHEGSRSIVGDSNHILFFDAGAPFRISYPGGGGDESTFLLLDPDFLADFLRAHPPRHEAQRDLRFPVERAPSATALYLLHRAILRECAGNGADSLAMEESVVRLAEAAFRVAWRGRVHDETTIRDRTQRSHRELVESLKTVLGGQYKENRSLGEIARTVHASPWHLCRVFKRETGMPIHRYRTRLRLREALEGVLERSGSLTDLALDLGFSSHSHFSDAFRREFGFSPSLIRKIATARLVARLDRRLVA